jgi:16S rRNA processing protein RimM
LTDIAVGRIAGVFGVRGELKCDPTSAGRTLFLPGAQLRCVRGAEASTIRIAAVRAHGRRLLLRIEGVEDADAAGRYAGARLCVDRDQIALAPGEYLDDDLIGCNVENVRGTHYGAVERVEHYPSSDLLVVGGRMVPLVSAIVTKIELRNRLIIIDPPAGLMD